MLVAQAANRVAGHLTWPGLGEFGAVFTLVWIAWANGSLHHELHGRDDARSRRSITPTPGAPRPPPRGCGGAAVALACLALGAARPAPLVLGLALVLLLGIPWMFAVAHPLTNATD